ncbi:hypothetical protein LIS83_29155 (plasmid) [Bacillus anthracis]|uniref:hypothetical protein n=2 Tax=Bacillaceae TaxID=186817 RepID=UPI00207AA271|nr:hypothetical protein [Bacillus anthracis]USL05426.1 hypothetical protein LIS83_29155 [Bacillus anthracis]
MVTKMKFIAEKFIESYENGANALAMNVGDDIIKQYILEHAELKQTGVTNEGDCECGCDSTHIYEERSIDNDVTPEQVISDDWITVTVDGDLYAVRKKFFEVIYKSDLELLKEEIEDNYDDFTGFCVILCPECKQWSVCD